MNAAISGTCLELLPHPRGRRRGRAPRPDGLQHPLDALGWRLDDGRPV
jgi:hypothetical protein